MHYFPQLKGDPDLLNAPMFGQNAIVVRPGSFNKGEAIQVISRREPIFPEPEGA